jgi:HK97 family phage major capsid protein
MKKKLQHVRDRMAAIIREQETLLDLAGDEGLTTEAQTKYETLTTEFDALKVSAKQIEDSIERAAYLSEVDPQDRVLPGLSRGEQREIENYSFGRVFAAAARGEPLDGLEGEMVAVAQKEARESGIAVGRWAIPSAAMHVKRFRADQTATGTNEGSQTIATAVSVDWVTPLLSRVVLQALGATILTGLQGNILIPTFADTTEQTEKGENVAADEVTSATGSITLTPNRLPVYVDISEQLLIQGNPSVEAFMRSHLLRKTAVRIDKMAINGSGASNQPLGILNTVGIGAVDGGAAGGAPDWGDIVDLETAVAVADADVGRIAYLTNPKVRGKLKKTPVVTGTDSQMVWDRQSPETPLNGYRTGVTTAVPSNLVDGASGSVLSAIIFGNFEDLIIAQWGGFDVKRVVDKTNAISGLVTLVVTAFYDAAVQRPASFAAMKDAITV